MLEKTEIAFRDLISALQVARLYPNWHPQFKKSTDKAYISLKDALAEREALVIGIVGDELAFETTRLLATSEGVFVGMSSGAAVAGALRVASRMEFGTVVVILPDRGDRYLSTTLFRSICAKCPP